MEHIDNLDEKAIYKKMLQQLSFQGTNIRSGGRETYWKGREEDKKRFYKLKKEYQTFLEKQFSFKSIEDYFNQREQVIENIVQVFNQPHFQLLKEEVAKIYPLALAKSFQEYATKGDNTLLPQEERILKNVMANYLAFSFFDIDENQLSGIRNETHHQNPVSLLVSSEKLLKLSLEKLSPSFNKNFFSLFSQEDLKQEESELTFKNALQKSIENDFRFNFSLPNAKRQKEWKNKDINMNFDTNEQFKNVIKEQDKLNLLSPITQILKSHLDNFRLGIDFFNKEDHESNHNLLVEKLHGCFNETFKLNNPFNTPIAEFQESVTKNALVDFSMATKISLDTLSNVTGIKKINLLSASVESNPYQVEKDVLNVKRGSGNLSRELFIAMDKKLNGGKNTTLKRLEQAQDYFEKNPTKDIANNGVRKDMADFYLSLMQQPSVEKKDEELLNEKISDIETKYVDDTYQLVSKTKLNYKTGNEAVLFLSNLLDENLGKVIQKEVSVRINNAKTENINGKIYSGENVEKLGRYPVFQEVKLQEVQEVNKQVVEKFVEKYKQGFNEIGINAENFAKNFIKIYEEQRFATEILMNGIKQGFPMDKTGNVPTTFAKNSEKLVKYLNGDLKGSPVADFNQPYMLFARAGEMYVQYQLGKSKYMNGFLSNVARKDDMLMLSPIVTRTIPREGKMTTVLQSIYPFPIAELEKFNKGLENVLNEIVKAFPRNAEGLSFVENFSASISPKLTQQSYLEEGKKHIETLEEIPQELYLYHQLKERDGLNESVLLDSLQEGDKALLNEVLQLKSGTEAFTLSEIILSGKGNSEATKTFSEAQKDALSRKRQAGVKMGLSEHQLELYPETLIANK